MKFNYYESDLLDNYNNAKDVPLEILKRLNVFSENEEENWEKLNWFKDNFEAIKLGYKSKKEWEEDIMDSMYPEGYDPDSDGGLFNDD